MTEETFAEARPSAADRAKDVAMRAKDAGSVALGQLTSWDFFKWTVVALLALNLLVMILFFGGIKSSLAELKQDKAAPDQNAGDVRAEVGKQMADVKAALTQAIADMQSGLHDDIAKINAKLDARTAQPPPQPKPVAQPATPKPAVAAKPKRPVTTQP
jgi:hypothetical protein